VHTKPVVPALLGHDRLAGVHPDADAKFRTVGPRVGGEDPLRLRRCHGGLTGEGEYVEEGVSLSIDLLAAVGSEGLSQDRLVLRHDLAVSVAELLKQTSGSLDIGEEERNRASPLYHAVVRIPIGTVVKAERASPSSVREYREIEADTKPPNDEVIERVCELVNEYWTVAAVLGHIAFWDGRMLALAEKLERGIPFSPSDAEPEDVDWINDASRPLISAIPARECARLALAIAEETDARVATLPLDRLWPRDPEGPLYAVRAAHRGEHLDDVEAALRSRH
jgi:hypothetical protein